MTGIVLVWSVLPFLWIVANRPFNDIFVARTVADVKLSLNSGGHLQFLWGAENHPSLEALVLVLSQFFSIDPQVLQFVPIGGVLRFVMLFALARRLLQSSVLGALVASSAAFDYSFGISVNTIFTHAFGSALYFSFLFVYLMLLRKKSLNAYVLLVVVFVGAYFFSYVSAVWMIALLGFVLLIGYAQKLVGRRRDDSTIQVVGPSLFLAFFVAFVAFNQIIYQAYFVNFLQRDYSLVVIRFLSGIIAPPNQAALTYRAPTIWPLTALNIIYTAFLVFVPAIFLAAPVFRRTRLGGRSAMDPKTRVLFTAMILSALLDSTLYFLYGFLDLKYVSIMFPLLSAGILHHSGVVERKPNGIANVPYEKKFEASEPWRRETIVTLLVIALVLMNLGRFGLAIQSNNFSRFSNTNATPSSEWLLSHFQGSPAVLADMSTLGKLDMYASGLNRTVTERFYDPFWFEYVVTPGRDSGVNLAEYANFLMIDQQASTLGTDTQLWSVLPPLGPQVANLNAHPDLALVYTEGAVVIYAVQRTS